MKHSKEDIAEIISKYITGGAMKLQTDPSIESFRYVAEQAKRGNKELRKLKLSRADRKHLHLLRGAFTNLQKGCEAAARLDLGEYISRMKKANELAVEYDRASV